MYILSFKKSFLLFFTYFVSFFIYFEKHSQKKLKVMSKNPNSTNRSKHYLKCHLIFVCKYRKKLLVGKML